jgi:signal transduction histidine kinase
MGSIHKVIASHQTEILDMWTQSIREQPSARGLTPSELASTIPAYLAVLGANGTTDTDDLSDDERQIIEQHLSSRLRSGFELNEILTEFTSLGRCVFRCMSRDSAADARDMDEVFATLQLTATEVTKLFNEQLLEDEQTIKRYTRLLRDIATAGTGLHESGPPLRKCLTDMLAVIMDAMAAQTAALLLLDSKTNQLIMSASTGDADEQLERYVSSGDAATFAGKIASGELEATAVADAETTELEVTDTLRRSGIHSLLGVRLSAHHSLRGVVYIGIRERRSFSASEVRRLESLGGALTIHLENARLYATLHAKIDEAKSLAEQSERFVSALLADLQGPLTAARVNARKLLELPMDDGPAALATRVVRNVDFVNRIVDDLVDAQSIRAGGRLPLTLADCELGAVALGVVEELRAVYADRFIVRADEAVRGIWDAAQIARAIWHLVTNAIEHGDKDAPIFVIVSNGPHAKVGVHNAGPAIADERQARLFEPYSQLRLRNHRHHHGWGLGLTLVWGCAEAHGGHVEVKSTSDKGTTFVMSLPYDARPYADS